MVKFHLFHTNGKLYIFLDQDGVNSLMTNGLGWNLGLVKFLFFISYLYLQAHVKVKNVTIHLRQL